MQSNDPRAASLIKTAREAAGMSMYALAQASGVRDSLIGKYERGEHQPSLPVLIALIEATGHQLKIEIV